MTQKDVERKQLILIDYLQELVNNYATENWKVKAEYSTNDNDKRVITVQEQDGNKVVFYGDCTPLFNYYMIDIYGLSIQENKNLSLMIGSLIGKNIIRDVKNKDNDENIVNEKWQLMFMQWVNPQAIEYLDIKRVGYNSTLKCVVNKVYENKEG
jgi:hypothetical protein